MSNFITESPASTPRTQAIRRALAAFVPAQARRFARRYADLDAHAKRVFILRTIRRLTRREDPSHLRPVAGYHQVLFVCHGNILRSPFAAALLKRGLTAKDPSFIIDSAGLHARSERPADPRGVAAALSLGIDLRSHRAVPLTRERVRATDLLVVMDFVNEAECIARFPEAEHKVRFLGAFDPSGSRSTVEIPDPYTLDDAAVAQCYADVARCITGLRASLVDMSTAGTTDSR